MRTHASNSRKRSQDTTAWTAATTVNRHKCKRFHDEALAITMHAMCTGTHSTLGSSPGSLVFNRDMFLNIPLIADWHAITKRREHLVNKNLMREYRKRCRHDYTVDHRVLKKHHNLTKLGPRTTGGGSNNTCKRNSYDRTPTGCL